MILLQAAIGAGIFLIVIFAIMFLAGVPFFTSILMKAFRKIRAAELKQKTGELLNKKANPGTDWLLLFLSIVFAIVIVTILFFIVVVLLDKAIPSLD